MSFFDKLLKATENWIHNLGHTLPAELIPIEEYVDNLDIGEPVEDPAVTVAQWNEDTDERLEMLTKSQRDVYYMILMRPFSTARELGMEFCPTNWKKPGRRVAELIAMGLVEVGETRVCSYSGFNVSTYNATSVGSKNPYSQRIGHSDNPFYLKGAL